MSKSPIIDDLLDEQRRLATTDLSASCPRCQSAHVVCSGHVRGRQRYQCQDCHYHFSMAHRGKSPALKRMALHLYLEGNGFRAIGRLLGVSNVTVLNWIHHFGEAVGPIRKPEDGTIEIVEIDEMFSFIQQKKNTIGSGSLWIGGITDSSVSYWVYEVSEPDGGSGSNSTTPIGASA